jgi:hypothetical protein
MLGAKTTVRFEHAIEDIEKEQYTFQRLLRDVVAFYEDSIGTLMYVTGPDPTTTTSILLTVSVAKGTNKKSETFTIPLPAGTALTCTDLQSQSPGNQTKTLAAASHVKVTVPADDQLAIEFYDLKGAVGVGDYVGEILQDDKTPLVGICLQIT